MFSLSLLSKFLDTITKRLGRTELVTYDIRLKGTAVVRSRPYQFAPPKLAALRSQTDKLLEQGVIRPSTSPYAGPAFLVPKKPDSWRMVVNYKKANDFIQLDNIPSPTFISVFRWLNFYSLLNLNLAYNQISLTERSKKYPSFVTPYGQFEYNQVPFGFASVSLVLNRLINLIFGDVMYRYVYLYFDDICIFTPGSFEEHMTHLEDVINWIIKAGLTINPEKMTIAAHKQNVLGHTFSNGAFSIDTGRIQPIQDIPTPTNLKQVQIF